MARALLIDTSIRTRVLLLAIAPLLIICLILGYYVAVTRLNDIEETLRDRGTEMARHLARESEFGLFSEDTKRLNNLADITTRGSDVYEVTVRDASRNVLVRSRNKDMLPTGANATTASDDLLLTFTAPVFGSGITISDHDEQYSGMVGVSTLAQDEVLGWVELKLSKADTITRQQVIIKNILILTTGAALFSGLIAMLIGRGIVRPMTRLSQAVDSLRTGNLDARVSELSGGEIGALESGFNHMAEELQRSQSYLQQEIDTATSKLSVLLESLPVAVYRAKTGALDETVFITPNAAKLTGFSPEAFVRDKSLWRDRIHPEDAPGVLNNLPSENAVGTYEFEYRWRIADGTYKWFYDYVRIVGGTGGSERHMIGMWQDITEFKRISQKLRNTIGTLEKRNRELDAARQKALAASEEKARFLANMSHEIRTPLNAIIGYTSLLAKSNLDTEQYEYARTVSRASAQLLRVIDDILSFSRLESGTVQLEKRAFDLRDAFEDVISMLSPEAQDKGLELVLLIDFDVPVKLIGDPDRINQVLTNLVSNAIKFTETGGVNVQVMRLEDGTEETEIEVRVSDTGIGMSEDVLENIFTSFHQADASISRRYGGTGLGLAIVEKLVEIWGGRVSVTSEVGKGSTFSFTIRCGKQPHQEERRIGEELLGRKVLLYDDNPVAARAVRSMLLSWSGNVFQAKDRSHIEPMILSAAAAGERYELVLIGDNSCDDARHREPLDELVASIRRDCEVPVLLLVNRERTIWPNQALSDPGLGVMIKPVRRDLLYRQICDLVGLSCEPPHPVAAPAAAHADEFKDMHVLLAEDNDFNRTLVTTVLESGGVTVTSASSGDEAVELAARGEFDMVIMDIHLPGVDGVLAARRIRSLEPRGRRVPIIALTADVFFDNPETLAEADMDACLLKPLVEHRLWQLLRELRTSGEEDRVYAAGPRTLPRAGPEPVPASRAAPISRNLLSKLVAELPGHRGRIERAIENGDREVLGNQLHELKGVAGYFGFSGLFEAVSDFERAVAHEALDPARIEARFAELSGKIDELVDELLSRAEADGTYRPG